MSLCFVVNSIGNSELSHDLLKFIEDKKINTCIFFQNNIPPIIPPQCTVMNITGLSGFTGTAVATDLDSAVILYNNNSNTDNWIYMYDLPWTHAVIDYEKSLSLLKDFKLIARSETHKKNIENFTGRSDIYLAKNMDELYKCLTLTK
jgi:hypothetical protein